MSASELNFLTAACSKVRFNVGVRNFHFEVFLVDSRMDTCCGISTTWWGVYLVSKSSPFTIWCWSPHKIAIAISFNNYAPMPSRATYRQTPLCVWALDRVLEPSCPWWKSSSLGTLMESYRLASSMWLMVYHPWTLSWFSLVRSPDELPLERASPMLFTDMVHSCTIHWKWWHCSTTPLCTIPCALANPSKFSHDPQFLVLKLSHGLVLTGWWARPNCNLVLNYTGSPRRLLRQKLQDGKRISFPESMKRPL
jgi:hypothetical protein